MLTGNQLSAPDGTHPSILLVTPLIKQFEGLALKPYLCPAGLLTIGYGHVVLSHEDFPPAISEEQAHQLLIEDINKFYPHVCKFTPNAQSYNLGHNQIAALISFTFNVGIVAFRASTLRRKIIRRDTVSSIASEFDRWVYAGGQKLQGLVIRRKKEKLLFLS